jgi:hypothetical protein
VQTLSQLEGPPREVTVYMDEDLHPHRRVSLDLGGDPTIRPSDQGRPSSQKGSGEDRMAIMAAVAMTELLGGNKNPLDTNRSTGTDTEVSTPELSYEQEAKDEVETCIPARRVSGESSFENENLPPLKKAKMFHYRKVNEDSPVASSEMTPYASYTTGERSPLPATVRTPHTRWIKPFPPPTRFPYCGHGPPPPHLATPHGQYQGIPPMYHSAMSPHAATPPRHHRQMLPHPHHHYPLVAHQGSMVSPMPPLPMYNHPATQPRGPNHHIMNPTNCQPPPPMRASPTYEDVIRCSGLPKSLSFRKICSKCGKTRGEHGETGYGNKCQFQECGKCGAGIHIHVKANTPMGILCSLTVEDGATPGAATSYERKIRDLAARADLQKELQKRKQGAQRAVPAIAP